MQIPLLYMKDKQVFTKKDGPLRLIGKPLDVARKLKDSGFQLIHFVDMDALSGQPTNLDVYDGLTYFINVEVECAPKEDMVKKLLSLKCRVVLPPGSLDVSGLKEKKLLVARIPKGYQGSAEGFHDVILDDAADAERFEKLGKRIIIYEKAGKEGKAVWGVITTYPS